mgnify:FL=1
MNLSNQIETLFSYLSEDSPVERGKKAMFLEIMKYQRKYKTDLHQIEMLFRKYPYGKLVLRNISSLEQNKSYDKWLSIKRKNATDLLISREYLDNPYSLEYGIVFINEGGREIQKLLSIKSDKLSARYLEQYVGYLNRYYAPFSMSL